MGHHVVTIAVDDRGDTPDENGVKVLAAVVNAGFAARLISSIAPEVKDEIEIGSVWRVRNPAERRRTVQVLSFAGEHVVIQTLTAVSRGGKVGQTNRVLMRNFRTAYEPK